MVQHSKTSKNDMFFIEAFGIHLIKYNISIPEKFKFGLFFSVIIPV